MYLLPHSLAAGALKTESCHDANFVDVDSTACCYVILQLALWQLLILNDFKNEYSGFILPACFKNSWEFLKHAGTMNPELISFWTI